MLYADRFFTSSKILANIACLIKFQDFLQRNSLNLTFLPLVKSCNATESSDLHWVQTLAKSSISS